MEIQEALGIMRALADGVNPANGEALMADAEYRCAPVVRTFHRAVGARPRVFQKGAARQCSKSWSRAENQQVCEELRRGIDFHQIAKTQSNHRFDHRAPGEAGEDWAEHAAGYV